LPTDGGVSCVCSKLLSAIALSFAFLAPAQSFAGVSVDDHPIGPIRE
jgi:hypothetical protein